MATLFARLTAPERLGDVAPAADRVTEAMLSEPYLVGGRHRVDTDVMRVTGDVVVKSGAEALECAAVLSSGLGVAVKIDDGGSRASAPALIHVLRQIDGLTAAHLRDAGVPRVASRAGRREARRVARNRLRPAPREQEGEQEERQGSASATPAPRVTSEHEQASASPCSACTRPRWTSRVPEIPAA